ncbi:hypothetical protein BaRGS_00039658 [Batillaria attramentaria]|uniref:EGF-like domain-containing protein n=1 Tax=Batillaria attramentaria TaxID=370345 RepID=A0ABD0J2N4_9CAEN
MSARIFLASSVVQARLAYTAAKFFLPNYRLSSALASPSRCTYTTTLAQMRHVPLYRTRTASLACVNVYLVSTTLGTRLHVFRVGISAGDPCTSGLSDPSQCIGNATCSRGQCECDSGFVSDGGVCKIPDPVVQVLLGEACPDPLCSAVLNANCRHGVCECASGFHDSGNKTTCVQSIAAGGACTSGVSDPSQCTGNAICARGRCECGAGFFSNGGLCKRRGLPGQPCSATVKHPEQCVDKASCTGDVCACDDNFYNTRGACEPRVPLDHTCNSTINDNRQCVDNANCTQSADNAYSYLCQCVAGYFNRSGICSAIPRGDDGDNTVAIVAGVLVPLVLGLGFVLGAIAFKKRGRLRINDVSSSSASPPHTPSSQGNSAHEEDDDHKSQSAVDAASIDIGDPDLFLIPAPAFPVPQAPPPLTHAGIVADTAGVLQPVRVDRPAVHLHPSLKGKKGKKSNSPYHKPV